MDEELPPPYSLRASNPTRDSSPVQHLQQHLASLPGRIRMTREARTIQQSVDDASLLDLLLPEIDDFLASLGDLHPTPAISQLTLVPRAAVPPQAVLSGAEEMRRRGEPCRVVRVDVMDPSGDSDEKGKKKKAVDDDGNSDWSKEREFSDWGRFKDDNGDGDSSTSHSRDMFWWRDEDMAHRLARHLQPSVAMTEQSAPPPLQTTVQAAVEHRLPAQKEKDANKKKKGGWLWGKKSGGSSTFATESVRAEVTRLRGREDDVSSTSRQIASDTTAAGRGGNNGGGARMSVVAEEVAFRNENDFGIMESVRGWAIVVVVHVKT